MLYCAHNSYTGWPRKNATNVVVNFMNIVDKTFFFFFFFLGRTLILQQNDTMIISFGCLDCTFFSRYFSEAM